MHQQASAAAVASDSQQNAIEAASAAVSAEQTDAAQLQQQQQAAQQMFEQLAAAAAHLQRAQAEVHAPQVGIQQMQQAVLQNIPRSEITGAGADAQAEGTTGSGSSAGTQQEQEQMLRQSKQLAWVLKLGPALSSAVKQTQLVRLLSALLLAYAILSGWDLGMPPAVLVMVMDVLVIASAVVVLSSTRYGQRLEAAEAAAEGDKEVQIPKSLRSFDVLSLFPGARELIKVFTGYRQFANALSEDVAVYIVGLGLLTVIISGIPA